MNRRRFLTQLFGACAGAALPRPAAWLARLFAPTPGAWVSYRFKFTVLPAPPFSNRLRSQLHDPRGPWPLGPARRVAGVGAGSRPYIGRHFPARS